MPTVPIYIRKADYDKWKAIEKPAQFVSDALNGFDYLGGVVDNNIKAVRVPEENTKKTSFTNINQMPMIPGVVRGADFVPKPPDPETGYPCCVKKRPCKHWVWNDVDTIWVNSLTGKTRDE